MKMFCGVKLLFHFGTLGALFHWEHYTHFQAHFSLVSNMSDYTQSSPQSKDILRLKHLIIEKNREISELLEECESRILTKQ